jgi:2-polyprenyl-3-methyl-5-hydroxy-6-metoxy-1,4-benzoquinol methylase
MITKKQNILKPQVPKSQYFESLYLNKARFTSYGYQLQEIYRLNPNNILEIGIGPGLVTNVLHQVGYKVTTIDFDPTLKPKIIASVTKIPFESSSFDLVTCFEVLEHIPWELVSQALREIARITRKYAIISLPDAQRVIRLHIPGICRERMFTRPFSVAKEHIFNGEHYWEINKKGYPLEDLIKCITDAGFLVEYSFRAWEISKHRFFRLQRVIS